MNDNKWETLRELAAHNPDWVARDLRDLLAERDALLVACQQLLAAVKRATDEGSINHLDAGPDGGEHFYGAVGAADLAIRKAKGGAT